MGKRKPVSAAPAATPRTVIEAWFPRGVNVAGVALQPVTALHWMALEVVGSPLVTSAPHSTYHTVLGLLLLSKPPHEAHGIALRDDLPHLVEEMAARIPADDIIAAVPRLQAHIDAPFAAAIPSAPGEDGDPLSTAATAETPAPDSAGS